MMLPIQETAVKFESLVQKHKYHEASHLLADDFEFSTPLFSFRSKEEWLQGFPKAHKRVSGISFGNFQEHKSKSNSGEIYLERRGEKKMALLKLRLKQIVEVDRHGKLKSIRAVRE